MSAFNLASTSPASRAATSLGRTLKSSIGCSGVGLHSGNRVTMVLHPAEAGTGIRFRRTDVAGRGAEIAALWSNVGDTRLNTTLTDGTGVTVGTVEHLMSAFAVAGVDDCRIEIGGAEIPVMDGSAAPFLFLIECAGVVEHDTPRRAIRVLKRVAVQDGDRMASLTPGDGFSVSFQIDFANEAIARQDMDFALTRGAFKADIARARTFGFEQEVAQLRQLGLARGGSLDNAVVIDATGTRVLNDDGLRYGDEFVRHKILDAIGDLYLFGHAVIGAYTAYKSGHALNNKLVRAVLDDPLAYEIVTFEDAAQAPAGMAELAPAW
jgi:UDP-3-O-[3-hydroxymyristoyl] N-acetylglucosamine deacetylase